MGKNYSCNYGPSRPGTHSAFGVVIVLIVVMAAICYYGFIEQ